MATELLIKIAVIVVCLALDFAMDGDLDLPFPLRKLTAKEIRLLNWLKRMRKEAE